MTYLFINPDNEYPRHAGDILLQHPEYDGVTLPEGWKPVISTSTPDVENDQVVYEVYPELVDGIYVQSWAVRPMTEEEIYNRDNPPVFSLPGNNRPRR